MNFQQAVTTCFSNYVNFDGRAIRSEYWYWVLFVFVVSAILNVVSVKLGLVFSVATFLPSIAVTIRRLHDTGRSGWWWLVALVPLVGWIILLVFMAQEGTAE